MELNDDLQLVIVDKAPVRMMEQGEEQAPATMAINSKRWKASFFWSYVTDLLPGGRDRPYTRLCDTPKETHTFHVICWNPLLCSLRPLTPYEQDHHNRNYIMQVIILLFNAGPNWPFM